MNRRIGNTVRDYARLVLACAVIWILVYQASTWLQTGVWSDIPMKVLVPSDTRLASWLAKPTELHRIVRLVLAMPLWLGLLLASVFRSLWLYAPEKKLRERQYYPPR